MSSAGINSDINHIPSSTLNLPSSMSGTQTKLCDNQTNCCENEVMNFNDKKKGYSAAASTSSEGSQSACCVNNSQSAEQHNNDRLNGISHPASTGDNGISKHLLSMDQSGGARPKTTKNIKDSEPAEMISPSCGDCKIRENCCDNSTQKENSSACVERDKYFDNLLVQLENASLKGADETDVINGIDYFVYESEKQMPDIMRLITKDLSEPYSIYTYRYFIHNWPKLCFLAMADGEYVGAIVCKLDVHKKLRRRGYIAMLAVDSRYRRRAIGSTLVTKAIQAMIRDDCDEVVLETEISNMGALHLYQNLGFVRDKRLFRYYLNGVDALRLKLWLR